MCVILFKPEKIDKASISTDTLYNCWLANPHGAGLMYAYHGRMIVWKGMMTFEKFLSAWKAVPQNAVIVAHFRIATHGKRDESMTHPFWVYPDRLAMVHNGILAIKAREGDGLSDTATFVEDVLRALPAGWSTNPAIMHLLDGYCGYGNKLVFLDRTGLVTIINERAGTWHEGCWYSNTSYHRVNYVQTATEPILPRPSLRERWGRRKEKRDPHKDAAQTIITAARSKHASDDEAIARDLGITLEELRDLAVGTDDEAAIRSLEAKVEKDNREGTGD